ncbi:MAG: hypothetical protein ABGX16_01755 [Pirellulales bacterium]
MPADLANEPDQIATTENTNQQAVVDNGYATDGIVTKYARCVIQRGVVIEGAYLTCHVFVNDTCFDISVVHEINDINLTDNSYQQALIIDYGQATDLVIKQYEIASSIVASDLTAITRSVITFLTWYMIRRLLGDYQIQYPIPVDVADLMGIDQSVFKNIGLKKAWRLNLLANLL